MAGSNCLLAIFAVFSSIVIAASTVDLTCSQIVNDPRTKDDKYKAQLCHLAELADVLNAMATTLQEAMGALLNEQGINVAEESNSIDVDKRKNEYLRFGKRKHEYLRFGKRGSELLRFGK